MSAEYERIMNEVDRREEKNENRAGRKEREDREYFRQMYPEEVKKYDIGDVLPVVIFMDNDKEVFRLVGEKSKEEIVKAIEENVL